MSRSEKHLILVGFMGSGKSTVGALLARSLERAFVDLDEVIEDGEGRTIREIFESKGEEYFRGVEGRRLRECLTGPPIVLALGGGTFDSPVHRKWILLSGHTVWLDVPVDLAWRRCLENNLRPLAVDELRFRELHARRRAGYRLAHTRLDVNGKSPDAIVREIIESLEL